MCATLHSVIVNSFSESEALSSLNAAERPRPPSRHKAALPLHFDCMHQRKKSTCCFHRASDANQCYAFVLHHSHTSRHFTSLRFLSPDTHDTFFSSVSVKKPTFIFFGDFSFLTNPNTTPDPYRISCANLPIVCFVQETGYSPRPEQSSWQQSQNRRTPFHLKHCRSRCFLFQSQSYRRPAACQCVSTLHNDNTSARVDMSTVQHPAGRQSAEKEKTTLTLLLYCLKRCGSSITHTRADVSEEIYSKQTAF